MADKCHQNSGWEKRVLIYNREAGSRNQHSPGVGVGTGHAAGAKPSRALPTSNTVTYLARNTSPRIQRGPEGEAGRGPRGMP